MAITKVALVKDRKNWYNFVAMHLFRYGASDCFRKEKI